MKAHKNYNKDKNNNSLKYFIAWQCFKCNIYSNLFKPHNYYYPQSLVEETEAQEIKQLTQGSAAIK